MKISFTKGIILILLGFSFIYLNGNQKMPVFIELQYFEGCPNVDTLDANIKSAITNYPNKIKYQKIEIKSVEHANEKKFRGSPSLLINGQDFEGKEILNEFGLTCRYYPNGVPSVDKIINKIDSILTQNNVKKR